MSHDPDKLEREPDEIDASNFEFLKRSLADADEGRVRLLREAIEMVGNGENDDSHTAAPARG